MSGVKIALTGVAGELQTDANGNAKINAPLTPEHAGFFAMLSENDNGLSTGSRRLSSPETGGDYRLRSALDTSVFTDTFNASAQNTDKWAYAFTTMTASQPGNGVLQFGTVQGTAAGHGAFMRTFQYFALQNTSPLAVDIFFGVFGASLVAGETWLAGLGTPTVVGTPPTDGVWIKMTSAGAVGVISYNGTPVESGVFATTFTTGEIHKVTIVIGENAVDFWKDDVLLGSMPIPAANGLPFLSGSQPVFLQKFCTGTVGNSNTMRVARVGVTLMDVSSGKSAPEIAALQGMNCGVGQNGHTMGTTAGNVNQLILPTTTAGSNTAANVTGLGGYGTMTAQATNVAAAGDMIATSYQNPVPTANITGRNLVITGVRISAINTGAAVATTRTTLLWGLAWGHTAVSLATADTASFATATTHSPRRRLLGFMSVPIGADIGAPYDNSIEPAFITPIVVRPGEFIATTVRFRVGTATALQEVSYAVMFSGYWE